VLAEKRYALAPGEYAERHGLHSQIRTPVLASAGYQHPATTPAREPPLKDGLNLAVVEYQQSRDVAVPC
jgi:hypothetical protein